MDTASFARGEAQANPDILEAIIQASETYSIIASRDIVDVRGLKLWSRGQPVSSALQQRLLERKLQHPIESCLTAEDGVTPFVLQEQLDAFLDGDSTLSSALRPWGLLLKNHLKQIPLHPVAQLLLTTALATRPDTLQHSISAMALAGALSQVDKAGVNIRLAMLGGLLHDIGEAYIQPQYLMGQQALDLLGHKHMMVHPRVAQMLLSSTTDYPAALCVAIGEHHERLNGSGYPARLAGPAISPLGLILAVVEVTMGILRAGSAPLTRAAFALRVVPGEFPPIFSSVIFNMARTAKEAVPAPKPVKIRALDDINETLRYSQKTAQTLQQLGLGAASDAILELALDRISRLRVAWNALGVWGLSPEDLTPEDQFEIELAWSELRLRLRELQRECMLLAEHLQHDERRVLEPIWSDMLVERKG